MNDSNKKIFDAFLQNRQQVQAQPNSYSQSRKKIVMPDMSIYKLVSQEVHKPDYRSKYCGKSQLRKKEDPSIRASAKANYSRIEQALS